jgi:hypothetical protein
MGQPAAGFGGGDELEQAHLLSDHKAVGDTEAERIVVAELGRWRLRGLDSPVRQKINFPAR